MRSEHKNTLTLHNLRLEIDSPYHESLGAGIHTIWPISPAHWKRKGWFWKHLSI